MMKKIIWVTICLLACLAFLAGGAGAAEFCVDNATDLNAALSTAASNNEDNTIKVVQWTYTGPFSYSSNSTYGITLLGGYTAGCASRVIDPTNTTLDGNHSGLVLTLYNGTGGNIQVEGFTIQNGADGGVYAYSQNAASSGSMDSGNVKITTNIIQGNSATSNGGGVYAVSESSNGSSGTVTLTDNVVSGNACAGDGGGVWAESHAAGTAGAITMTNNIVTQNQAVGSYIGGGGVVTYSYSAGSGVVTFTNNTVTDNTVTGSSAGLGGGADFYINGSGGTVNCYNNIIWGNTATYGGDVYLNKTTGNVAYGYNNDVAAWAGADWDGGGPTDTTNINADPLFADSAHGDYHLLHTSPCIDQGDNNAPGIPLTDFDGDNRIIDGNNDGTATVDMGADEYNPEHMVCVSTAAELQAALTAAETNDTNDIIMVVQGSYAGNFLFDSSEGFGIALLGGYAAYCSSRIVNPENTVLDGNHAGGVLALQNTNGGDILVDGFTIRNGTVSGAGGGVYAWSYSDSATAGNVTLANNIIQGNSATGSGSGGGASARSESTSGTAGNITLFNNIVTGNNSDTFGGGVFAYSIANSGSAAGTITLTNNIIAGNTAADQGGGGVYACSSAGSGSGGTVTLLNNTITANKSPGAASRGGGLFFSYGDNTINCYNNIIWGNTATTGDDIYFVNTGGTANGYNNDYATMSGSWDSAAGDINADPLFVALGDYHLRPASPCIDEGLNSAPGIPALDFEGDARVIDGNNDGTALADIGADEYSGFPPNGTIFAGCSLINKYQPTFRWTGLAVPFKSYTIYFSTSHTDFLTKGILITKANIRGTMSSYIPSSGTWKKFLTASWNNGSYRPIYWKVIGTRTDKSTVQSTVWNFSVDAAYSPEIIAPAPGAAISASSPPTFKFDTMCNVKFRLEISSVSNFSDPKKIKAFSYSVSNPNVQTVFTKAFTSGQWKALQKLIGIGGTGYFRVRGWDAMKRETLSAIQLFTITP